MISITKNLDKTVTIYVVWEIGMKRESLEEYTKLSDAAAHIGVSNSTLRECLYKNDYSYGRPTSIGDFRVCVYHVYFNCERW